MRMKDTACALGLYKYRCECPSSDLFVRFYSTIMRVLPTLGVQPSHIGVGGIGYPNELCRIGGPVEAKLRDSSFSAISSLSLVADAAGRDSPAYDAFMSTSCGYNETARELLLSFVINEAFMELDTTEFDALLGALVSLCRWDFGYGFSAGVENQPEFHICGIDSGKLSEDEYTELCAWYAAPADVRTTLLRDIYPYNLLNESQLDARVSQGVNVRLLAQTHIRSSLTRMTDYGLYLWRVPDSELAHLRQVLVGSPALILGVRDL